MKASSFFLAGCLMLATSQPSLRAHEHLPIGVTQLSGNNPVVGSPLVLFQTDGVTPMPVNNPTVYHLMPRPSTQRYGGYYTIEEQARVLNPNEYFAFTAKSDGQTQLDGNTHACTGAYIWAEITSVTGPPGGHFAFWDESQSNYRSTPNISFTTNTTTGNYKFEISEPISFPSAPSGAITEPPTNLHYIISSATTSLVIASDEDPYGHIHNRGFTADKPGDYYVGFTFYDMSKNGPSAGPLHAKSQTYIFHFQAGPDFVITANRTSATSCTLTWPSLMGIGSTQTGVVFTVQRSTDLVNWQNFGTVTGTTASTATLTDSTLSGFTKAFYRLQYSWRTSP